MPKSSTRHRIAGLAIAVAIGVIAAVGGAYILSGGNEASGDYTAVNRQLSLVARDVLHAVADWREAATPPAEDTPEGADPPPAPATPPGDGPVQLTVTIRDRSVDDLPDDLSIAICPDLQPWLDVNDAKGFKPIVAARSPSTLGDHVILYDGQGITTVPSAKAPGWVSGGTTWKKADVAGGDQNITLKR